MNAEMKGQLGEVTESYTEARPIEVWDGSMELDADFSASFLGSRSYGLWSLWSDATKADPEDTAHNDRHYYPLDIGCSTNWLNNPVFQLKIGPDGSPIEQSNDAKDAVARIDEFFNKVDGERLSGDLGEHAKSLLAFNSAYVEHVLGGKGRCHIERNRGDVSPPVWSKGTHYKIKATVGNANLKFEPEDVDYSGGGSIDSADRYIRYMGSHPDVVTTDWGDEEIRMFHADSSNDVPLELSPDTAEFWIRSATASIKESDRTLASVEFMERPGQRTKFRMDFVFSRERMPQGPGLYTFNVDYVLGRKHGKDAKGTVTRLIRVVD